MEKTHCISCGAPYDYEFNKCPYCGTTYLDSFIKDKYQYAQTAIPVFSQTATSVYSNFDGVRILLGMPDNNPGVKV